MTFPAPGLHDGVPAADYHRLDALSASGIVDILDCPATYRYYRDTPEARKDTEATAFGSLVHVLALEGEAAFKARYFVTPAGFTRAKKEDKALAAEAEGRGLIQAKQDDYDQARRIVDAIQACDLAAALLGKASATERSAVWESGGVLHKARFDIDAVDYAGVIADLKIVADPNPERFARDRMAMARAIQAALYSQGYALAAPGDDDVAFPDFAWIVAPSEPPYKGRVWVATPSKAMLSAARAKIAVARATYKACLASGEWRGYDAENITVIEAPPWWAVEEESHAE